MCKASSRKDQINSMLHNMIVRFDPTILPTHPKKKREREREREKKKEKKGEIEDFGVNGHFFLIYLLFFVKSVLLVNLA